MPEEIYILAPDGTPLMPTKRKRHVDALVRAGKARIVSQVPFVVQLLYDSGREVQPLLYSVDIGRTHIGIAVIKEDGTCVFLAECKTRNEKIRKLMEERKAHRMASRAGERKARQRLAVKHATFVSSGILERILPGCEKPITCKFIKNTEARFSNRKRPKGWLTPTANHLLQTHINLLNKVSKFLPISDVSTEVNRFAFASMENPDIKGIDFQNGPLKGFDDVDEAVYASQKGICLLCGKRHIERYHHIVPRSRGGNDTLPNKAGLCEVCHDRVHKEVEAKNKLAQLKAGMNKKYGALSVLNQISPYWAGYLAQRFGEHAHFVEGWQTAEARQKLGVIKDRKTNPCHVLDAYLSGLIALGIEPTEVPDNHTYFIKQYRRHDRAIIYCQKERTYKLDGKVVAKNRRKRTDQHEDSLHEFYVKSKQSHSKIEARRICSRLKVLKSTRSYNNPNKVMPGAEFVYHGERYILRGQQNGGLYFLAEGCDKRLPSKECILTKRNTGLVFVS